MFCESLDSAVKQTVGAFSNGTSDCCLISATGAHGIVVANREPRFKELLSGFGMNLPDGMPTAWIGKIKGAKRMQRCYGPDFFKELMIASANTDIKHFLCGGKEDTAEELKAVCESKFNNNNIVGTFSPPFGEMSDDEMNDLGRQIDSNGSDIVWVGLSTPKQEEFACRLSKYAHVSFICTVGAAFDFHTGKVKEAPRFIQKIGMEWLFRLIMEPKRLFRRYLKIVPLFLIYGTGDIIRFYYNKMVKGKTYVD